MVPLTAVGNPSDIERLKQAAQAALDAYETACQVTEVADQGFVVAARYLADCLLEQGAAQTELESRRADLSFALTGQRPPPRENP